MRFFAVAAAASLAFVAAALPAQAAKPPSPIVTICLKGTTGPGISTYTDQPNSGTRLGHGDCVPVPNGRGQARVMVGIKTCWKTQTPELSSRWSAWRQPVLTYNPREDVSQVNFKTKKCTHRVNV